MALGFEVEAEHTLLLQFRAVVTAHGDLQPRQRAGPVPALEGAGHAQLVQRDGVGQLRQPRTRHFIKVVFVRHLGQILRDGGQLVQIGLEAGALLVNGLDALTVQLHHADLIAHAGGRFPIPQIGCAAPIGLNLFVHVIVADLDVGTARLRQVRRVRCAQHIAAGRGVLHLEADGEVGVGADLVVHDARRVLGGQHQIDAQRTADGGRTDQRLHELRLLTAQFAELVGHDQQPGHRFPELARVEPLAVIAELGNTTLRKNFLAAEQLAVQRDHGALDVVADVRDFADHVGQPFQRVGQTAALVVDDDEGNVVGMIIHRQREQPCRQQFTLAGAGRTGHQTVRAVVDDIEVEGLAARHRTDGGAHVLPLLRPAVPCVQLLHRVHVHTL